MGSGLARQLTGRARGDMLRRLGDVSIAHLDSADGIRFLEEAVANDPPDPIAAKTLEPLHVERNDLAGVTRALQVQAEHAESVEERVGAWNRLAKLDLDRRDREAAANHYLRAFELERKNEPSLRFLAGYLIESGRYVEALPVYEAFEPMVEEGQDLDDPDVRLEMSTFWFNFGELLRNAGRPEDAIARYERALGLNPSHLLALEAVGALYIAARTWKKAEKAYRQVLQVTGGQGERSKVANAYAQLGLVERALGSTDKAEKRFAKALEVFPNHVPALKGMALMAADKQDWSNLLNIYNNVIYHATVPQDVIDAYMIKGQVLDEHMGRPDKAAQHYQRSLDFDPNQPAALLRLAELSLRQADWEQAASLAERALRLEGMVEVQRLRGALLATSSAGMRGLGQPDADARLRESWDADPRFQAIDGTDLDALRGVVLTALS
jgi:tetratricopeptide (TPR) repeat protein